MHSFLTKWNKRLKGVIKASEKPIEVAGLLVGRLLPRLPIAAAIAAVVGLIVLYSITAIRNGLSTYDEIGTINLPNEKYGAVALTVTDFDSSEKRIHLSLEYRFAPDVIMAIGQDKGSAEYNAYLMTQGEDLSLQIPGATQIPGRVQEVTVSTTIVPPLTYGAKNELDATVAGSSFCFPFDKYETNVFLVVQIPDSIAVHGTQYPYQPGDKLPFKFSLYHTLETYSALAKPTGNNSVQLTIGRPLIDQALLILLLLVLVGISLNSFVRSLLHRAADRMDPTSLLLAFICVVLVRVPAVGPQVGGHTLFDVVIVACFLLILCSIALRQISAKRVRDMSTKRK